MDNHLSFTAPKLTKSEIGEQADMFRDKYCKDILPVPISDIIEFKLGMNIEPVKELASRGDIEALLLGTLDTIVVDNDQFLDERFQNRMRFSLAHEIGHFVLHKEIIKKLKPASLQKWFDMIDVINNGEYIIIEQQAYEFAGRLLVPRLDLIDELKGKKEIVNKLLHDHPEINESTLIEYLSNNICKKFGVSNQVISKRIKVEKLWPIE
ncbi:MAG TPA: ImmA/IrrE family metallo-endopeptidase [Bacteroidota bacterium]|nr:ImmA/IrrE family metallo-endopeptidase [Bacteroidota bacterium]